VFRKVKAEASEPMVVQRFIGSSRDKILKISSLAGFFAGRKTPGLDFFRQKESCIYIQFGIELKIQPMS
jgi:hypothetical protein